MESDGKKSPVVLSEDQGKVEVKPVVVKEPKAAGGGIFAACFGSKKSKPAQPKPID